ncbi:hypothetical protein BZM27_53950 [Paraburkholderia steynii]|uniref:Uncharacterized protein n=1 Tax=Paraburkholderia steynii TaxID=1245441 RepID=A0A4R0WYR4_9BURK|nr:hypothetical protein BZM27_53950 [Paraburkholderia steynii]
MLEARENGKLLSDVVEVTWEHLKVATKPICYLRALLSQPGHFRYQLRRKNQDVAERKTKLKVEAQAERVARESAGHTFTDATGATTYVVGADGESMSVYKAGEGNRASGDELEDCIRSSQGARLHPSRYEHPVRYRRRDCCTRGPPTHRWPSRSASFAGRLKQCSWPPKR